MGLIELAGIIEFHRDSLPLAPLGNATSPLSWMIGQTLLGVLSRPLAPSQNEHNYSRESSIRLGNLFRQVARHHTPSYAPQQRLFQRASLDRIRTPRAKHAARRRVDWRRKLS